MMATLPAEVTIAQLPAGTTVTGAELFEAVQDGVSVQLTADQINAAALVLIAALTARVAALENA